MCYLFACLLVCVCVCVCVCVFMHVHPLLPWCVKWQQGSLEHRDNTRHYGGCWLRGWWRWFSAAGAMPDDCWEIHHFSPLKTQHLPRLTTADPSPAGAASTRSHAAGLTDVAWGVNAADVVGTVASDVKISLTKPRPATCKSHPPWTRRSEEITAAINCYLWRIKRRKCCW